MFKKEKNKISMRELFSKDVNLLNSAFEAMTDAVTAFCEGNIEKSEKKSKEAIQFEKKQDKIREKLVTRIFSKETMVFSRPDRLNLVEDMDKIVDEVEIVVRKMMQYHPEIPKSISEGLVIMVNDVEKTGYELKSLINAILEDFSKGEEFIKKITDYRRKVRNKHWDLLNKNYELKPKYLDFIYFKDLIKALCKVADRVEEFADKIHGLLCKYAL